MIKLISVIVPAYNIENYIERTLESLCNQSYSDIEIIVVDDGSFDDTLQKVNSFAKKDNRIKVFSKQNGGVTSARFYGVKQAKGDWIAFCDGDDTVEPDMYTILMCNAEKYSADISHCGYKMVFPNRQVEYYGTNQIIEQDTKKGIHDLLNGSIIEPGLWNKIYKKELLLKLVDSGLLDQSIKINEDLLMNYYLFKFSAKAVFQDVCLYNYIVHKNSAANSAINAYKIEDPIRVRKIICNDSQQNDEIHSVAMRNYINSLIIVATMPKKENKALITRYQKKYRKELRSLLLQNLHSGHFDTIFKLKILLATVFPALYKLIHMIYAKLTGLDKIYDIEE